MNRIGGVSGRIRNMFNHHWLVYHPAWGRIDIRSRIDSTVTHAGMLVRGISD